jgi:hypothetical protein
VQVFAQIFRRSSHQINKKHNLTPIISEVSRNKATIMGRRILVRYYIGTVSGRGDRKIIENYIKNQGREEDIKQLKLFET